MQAFGEYSSSFTVNCETGMLDYSIHNSGFSIFEGSELVLTPGKNSFSHASEAMIRLIITDLQLSGNSFSGKLTSSLLFSFLRDMLTEDADPFLTLWNNQIACDPFVNIKVSGKPSSVSFLPDDPLFGFSFNTLGGLLSAINNYTSEVISEASFDEGDMHPFPTLLKISYDGLSSGQKAAMQALSGLHKSGIVLPLLLVSDELTSVEYVNGLIALKLAEKEIFPSLLSDVAVVQTWLEILLQKKGREEDLSSLIARGEGDSIEFKSTLRWDIRAGKTSQSIERACLKTISAFLNSAGGNLLIGVRDDGSIEGLATDKFPNEDKFLLHLWTLIRTCLGRDFSTYIRTRIEKIDEKNVCIVSCSPSNRPVFLRQPGFEEEMYIRIGPSSNAISISEGLRYISDRFGKN
jgi:hypothetical protein